MTPWQLAKATEHSQQVALFAWAAMAANRGYAAAWDADSYKGPTRGPVFPVAILARLHAIHNQGHGDMIRGARAKAEGVRKGVPDIFLPAMRGGKGGLYIELKKVKDGRASTEQRDWLAALEAEGYAVCLCYGWEDAAHMIERYECGNW